ncbi:glycine oxidase [Alteromonadaceae bacterium 2753L.S.0a.02]|nr:glycine oxidase [Alteromonadaceae bacterium 2753L.S.0a.02]
MSTSQTVHPSSFVFPQKPLKIAIAGGGLLGRLLSWRLAKQGHAITLFEAGSFSQPAAAAFTAAGMISPFNEVAVSKRLIYEIGIHSIKLWENWLLDLPPALQASYARKGSLVVAHPQDESELHQLQQELNFHLGSDNSAQWVDNSEIVNLEKDLAQFQRGLYLPMEAHLDNVIFMNGLLELLPGLGCELYENTPVNLREKPSAGDKPLTAYDLIFDVRGVGAKESNPEVRGVRGEVLWVETQEVVLSRPVRLMHPRYKLYIVPRSNNGYILGATEIESEDMSPVSVHSCLELSSALYTLNPAFAEARITKLDVNLRPSLMDNMPHIHCTSSGDTPLIAINGLYRHGYLLAPTLVEQALALLEDNAPNLPFTAQVVNS